jgi:hypothetical protein
MDNQQPRTLEERIFSLGINAVFGDGYLWKHPECVNYKVIFTSVNRELLEIKYNIAPEIFSTGVKDATVGIGNGRFCNAKPLYRLASVVHPLFMDIISKPKEELFKYLTLYQLGLWYLDDGSRTYVKPKKETWSPAYRTVISIGNCCNSDLRKEMFTNHLKNMFGEKIGGIVKNNSKATVDNKVWLLTKPITEIVLGEAATHKVLPHKFRGLRFNDYPGRE